MTVVGYFFGAEWVVSLSCCNDKVTCCVCQPLTIMGGGGIFLPQAQGRRYQG